MAKLVVLGVLALAGSCTAANFMYKWESCFNSDTVSQQDNCAAALKFSESARKLATAMMKPVASQTDTPATAFLAISEPATGVKTISPPAAPADWTASQADMMQRFKVLESGVEGLMRHEFDELAMVAQMTQQEAQRMKTQFLTFMCSNQSLLLIDETRSHLDSAMDSVDADFAKSMEARPHKPVELKRALSHMKLNMNEVSAALPIMMQTMISQKMGNIFMQINATFVSVAEDLITIIEEIHDQNIPPMRALLSHSHQLVEQFTALANEISGVPIWDAQLAQAWTELQTEGEDAMTKIAKTSNEDINTAVHVLLEQQPGNRVDALQTIARAWLNVNQHVVEQFINGTRLSLGHWSNNITGLFSNIAQDAATDNSNMYQELLNATSNDADFKAELTAMLGSAGEAVVVSTISRLAAHMQQEVASFISQVNTELCSDLNSVLMQILADLSQHAPGDVWQQGAALSQQFHNDVKSKLRQPATQSRSYSEVLGKCKDVVKQRQAAISEQSKAALKEAQLRVHGVFRKAAVSMARTLVDDGIGGLRKDLVAKGLCDGQPIEMAKKQ